MPIEIRVPALGESVVEATVGRWMKKAGESVAAGDVVVELETDKINLEVHADSAGVLERIERNVGDTVGIGDILGVINESGAPVVVAASVASSNGAATPAKPEEPAPSIAATPVAKKIAAESNVDISKVPAAGARVTKEDVAAFISKPAESAAPVSAPPVSAPAPRPTVTGERVEERVRMSRRRQTIAKRLVEAQQTAAMLTTFNEVDMSAIMDIRKRRKDSFKERYGVNLGFMSFFTKACIGALRAFPMLNAEIQGDEIVKKYYFDIGVAVSTEEGLVVPVVRDADRLSFAEIEKEIGSLAVRSREGKLTLAELQGGCFTITNGGVFGSLLSTPILNTPQVGILGMHKIQERPVVVDGQIVIRPMMYLALSYDHRIVDGSEAVRFLVRVKELLEDPASLLFES